ncbi:outer membrane lipoprotein-sorting protein [Verminephrobacter eiseniae]|uniref:outer membrane lipoprotein-sorting protein n=1 Tax=Verminephrobacter eiseniae TaxID=364317 RepID=UPI002237C5CE|nr:outer membrane lipoprotein-sorting protein [Verminephrobacter eiseniae]
MVLLLSRRYWLVTGVGGMVAGWPISALAAPDAQTLLAQSDRVRCSGMPGVVFLVHVRNEKSPGEVEEDAEVLMRVKARDGSSTAEIIEPLRTKGLRLLQVQRNMWIYRPTMKKPVVISPRQRLSGQASLGDIASTGYARDYMATYLRRDSYKGETSHVLELTAGSTNTTYDRIIYWVSERTGHGIRAEFLSVSGKPVKYADFRYEQKVSYEGRVIPFMSHMVIHDALTTDVTTPRSPIAAFRARPYTPPNSASGASIETAGWKTGRPRGALAVSLRGPGANPDAGLGRDHERRDLDARPASSPQYERAVQSAQPRD